MKFRVFRYELDDDFFVVISKKNDWSSTYPLSWSRILLGTFEDLRSARKFARQQAGRGVTVREEPSGLWG